MVITLNKSYTRKMGVEIMEILKNLNHDNGVTIVMVTHDEKIAEQTTRIIRFLDGKMINA